jgi:hypothetical protein
VLRDDDHERGDRHHDHPQDSNKKNPVQGLRGFSKLAVASHNRQHH